MIHVLSKILGRKKAGSNDGSPNGSASPSPKNLSIWQKATSLRQSFRYSSRSKIGQKAGFDFPILTNVEKSATLGTPSSVGKSQDPQIRREWKSQRNLARERRSLVSKHGTTDDLKTTKRSLHSRSLCMAAEWDVDSGNPTSITQNDQLPPPPPPPPPANLKEPRSPRKLTKDSGYETSAHCDHDYANSISDWFSQEKALDIIDDEKSWSKDNNIRNPENCATSEKRLEWNARNRPLSFSHQEVASERAKNYRQLRHSYSQREVSRHSHQDSVDSLLASSTDIKKQIATSVESVNNWPNRPSITKSTPHLAQGRSQRLSSSSTGSLLLSEPDEAGGSSMVTRRFKKGSVYDALASTSGLDFSPVVQLKAYNRRDDTSPVQGSKASDNIWKKSTSSRKSSTKESDTVFYKDKPKPESSDATSGSQNSASSQECKNPITADSNSSSNAGTKCITAHEKYPSWPVTSSQSTTATQRSHSWTGQTDYPKEKVAYSRPKKSSQFKISTNHLQPVLERASDYNSCKSSEKYSTSPREKSAEDCNSQYQSCSASECSSKQFDFDAFQNPCIPQCYEEKEFRIHSPPERDISSASSSATGTHEESQNNESNGFVSHYEEVLRHQAQYSVPLSSNWSKQRNIDSKGMSAGPETPFLDRLRLESNWQVPPPPPVPMIPAASAQQSPAPQPQQLQPHGNDFELSSENGTWMGSMESNSHGRGIPKWQGSYSDLSTLSTQLSNRSSLFDSGHSTMPESGRLSPQSSCDSTAPSLLLEGPTRAQVVARHGCHREIIAHSARVKQPERHGSESVLYYATSSSRVNGESKASKNLEPAVGSGNQLRQDEAMYRSHASVTLSSSHTQSNEVPDCQNKNKKCPSRQDSRKSSNSFSSEDSFPRSRSYCGDDTSGSSSDISNITCISNYKSSAKSKSLDESSPICDSAKVTGKDQTFPNYKSGYDQPKSKSIEESPQKFVFPDSDKKQRVSDPDLKAIQKQAVMSFYQRMSLAESMKASEQKSGQQSTSECDPPPPYEAKPSSRITKYPQKLSLMPKKMNKHWENRNPNLISPQSHQPNSKPSDSGLLNHHNKSVPNLVALKGQTLDPTPSHSNYRRTCSVSQWTNSKNNCTNSQMKRGSPLSKDEIISWDQLPNVLEKKREATEKAAFSAESKDPPEDNGGCSSGMHYFKSHKSPRKVQLKEVHHSNETASVKVMTPDGVTLVQTHEQRRDEKIGAAPLPPHKRRPAPPPPPKQPPKRPPPPPPPVTPPPQVVVVLNGKDSENLENKAGGDLKQDAKAPQSGLLSSSASSPQLGLGCYVATSQTIPSPSYNNGECLDLPLPPQPKNQGTEIVTDSDEPLPPPPENSDVNVQPRTLDSSSLIYPKNSYMSYRSERKLGRQGFDGKYRRSFHTSASSVDLTTLGSSFQDGKEGFSPHSWEQMHNIRQHGTTVIFHSDCIQSDNRLQRSSSQDCVLVEEASLKETNNISTSNPSESEGNQSSSSINAQCSTNQDVPSQPVPYTPASQERNAHQTQNSHQSGSTKVSSSESPDNVISNDDSLNENTSSLDNNIMTDDSFVESDKDTSCFASVDHNQNAVEKNDETGESNSKNTNSGDLNRINSEILTTDAPKSRFCKTKEEIECEQLSIEFINQCGDTALKNVLVPSPNHKNLTDYMEGLLDLELETGGFPVQKIVASHIPNNATNNENKQKDDKWLHNEKCNTFFNSKMRISHCLEVNENQSADNEIVLNKKKDELVQSIEKKLVTLRSERACVQHETDQNEEFFKIFAAHLRDLALPNEVDKFVQHVEEMNKIINLLVSLSARLARAENILKNMPKEGSEDERKIVEAKREKLTEQHEDARRLKEGIDRRCNQMSTFLHRYVSDDEYAEYDRYIKLKTKLIMDSREIDEKINLGEEQLAALSVVAHLWKSANS